LLKDKEKTPCGQWFDHLRQVSFSFNCSLRLTRIGTSCQKCYLSEGVKNVSAHLRLVQNFNAVFVFFCWMFVYFFCIFNSFHYAITTG